MLLVLKFIGRCSGAVQWLYAHNRPIKNIIRSITYYSGRYTCDHGYFAGSFKKCCSFQTEIVSISFRIHTLVTNRPE